MRYGVFSRPKRKNGISGDAYTVLEEIDYILLALVDGLGSGEEAARAAQSAVECIRRVHAQPLLEILKECHRVLHNTRGAVMGLLRVEPFLGRVRYAGVGNVGIYTRTQESFHPISYNGIVGYRLPQVREFVGSYHPGDVYILYSDGVDSRFHNDAALLYLDDDPSLLAESIARRYGKADDDVCVLVAR